MKKEGVRKPQSPPLPSSAENIKYNNKNLNFLSWVNWVSDKSHCLLAKPVLSNARWGWGWGGTECSHAQDQGGKKLLCHWDAWQPSGRVSDSSFTGSQAAAVASLQCQQQLVFNDRTYIEKDSGVVLPSIANQAEITTAPQPVSSET